MVARRAVSDDHSVMRYAAKSKRFHDPDTALPLGLSLAAFEMRPEDQGGLSVTEIEFFGANTPATRGIAAAAYRSSLESKRLGTQGAFAWATVERIKSAASTYEKDVRVVHAPVDGNPGHAEVRRFSYDDLDILAFFATDVFVEYEVVAAMQIPPIEQT